MPTAVTPTLFDGDPPNLKDAVRVCSTEMLRHAEIGVTMNLYSHMSNELQREAGDALDRALFG